MSYHSLDTDIQQRLFLVGCPRSGTTLLQSFLAAHSEVQSFPESHFFTWAFLPNSLRAYLGLAPKETRPQLLKFFMKIQRPDLEEYLPKYGIFSQQYVKIFIGILDKLTLDKSKKVWLEKTPDHLRRTDYIDKFISDAKFIHIIRNGEDVIASLYEVTRRNPEFWGREWELDECIDKWISAVEISIQKCTCKNHRIVLYEDLVANPEPILKKIFYFIGINFEENVIKDRQFILKDIIGEHESWKSSVQKTVIKSKDRKFDKIFNDTEKNYISKKISHLDSYTKSNFKHK